MGIKTKRNFLQWFRFWLVLPGIQRQKENLCRRNQVTQWTRGSDLINSSLKLKGGQSFSSRDPSPSEPAPVSEPGVPRRVHATQVVQAVGCSHQRVDLALPALELGQVVEAGHDGGDRLLDQRHQLLGVHVLRLAGRGQWD